MERSDHERIEAALTAYQITRKSLEASMRKLNFDDLLSRAYIEGLDHRFMDNLLDLVFEDDAARNGWSQALYVSSIYESLKEKYGCELGLALTYAAVGKNPLLVHEPQDEEEDD